MCVTAFVPVGKAILGTSATVAQQAIVGTVTTLQAGVSLAQAALSIKSQKQAIESQKQAQKQQAEAERDRFSLEMSAKRINEIQEQKAVAQRVQEIVKESDEAISRATVSAREAGVSGLSVNAQLQSFEAEEAQALFIANDIYNDRLVASWLDDTNRQRSSENRLRSIYQPIPEVDYLSPVVNLAGEGLKIYSQAQQIGLNQSRLNNPNIN